MSDYQNLSYDRYLHYHRSPQKSNLDQDPHIQNHPGYMLYKLENDPINQNLKKQKYKEDLDFLVNLKNQKKIQENFEKYKDKESIDNRLSILQKENESTANKDKFFFSGLRQKYEKDIQNYSDQKRFDKETEIFREKRNLAVLSEKMKYEDQRFKEEKINKVMQQYQDMNEQKRIKEELKERDRITEIYTNRKNYEEYQKQFKDNYGDLMKNIKNKNQKVYENMSKFSDFIKNSENDNKMFYNNRSYALAVDPTKFNNDQDYNRIVTNFKEFEKKVSRNNMQGIQEKERKEELRRSKEVEELMKKERQQNHIVYKNILDQQVTSDRYIREKNQIGKDDFDGSLLPSYVYNMPSQPIYRKAHDSLQMFKEQMFKNKDEFFHSPPDGKRIRTNGSLSKEQMNLPQKEYQNNNNYMFDKKSYYLGNTSLNQNTIINPTNYSKSNNKFLNKFVQEINNENRYY